MTVPSLYGAAAALLLVGSAVLLVRSGVLLSELQVFGRLFLFGGLLHALAPPLLTAKILAARLRGRSTRLLRKRYRSLRRRAWRRFVLQYFAPVEARPASAERVALALLCAFAGFGLFLINYTPSEAVVARL